MKTIALLVMCILVSVVSPLSAGPLDDLMKGIKLPGKEGADTDTKGPDTNTTIKGLKEALTIGTENAVKTVSLTDGYFGNQLIKILMPEKIQKVADVLAKVGFQKQVDDFVMSMNRAAEKAAPQAKAIFVNAVKQMNFDDAQKILRGSDTAATEYFKSKTSGSLYAAFKPIISSSMDKVGATRSYKEMMGKYESLPFMEKESTDLDHYVTNKSLDGLFLMLGQEEKKIRTNPAARVTDLLKTVFGKR
jgi:RNA binding exosome subunit